MTLLDQLPDLQKGLGAPSVIEGVHELLDLLTDDPVSSNAYATLVRDCARARARLQALEMTLVAAADKARVPQASGAASASDWFAKTTNTEPAESSRQTKLAKDLCQQMLAGTQASLTKGELSTAHARVIAAALKRLPKDLSPEQVARSRPPWSPRPSGWTPRRSTPPGGGRWRRSRPTGARSTPPKMPSCAMRKKHARAKTRCTLHDNGDGTMRITATVPTLAGAILKKILDQMSSPRRGRLGATQAQIGAVGNPNAEGFEWDRRRGEALVSLIEHLPTDHLHGRVAASVIVKLATTPPGGLAPPASHRHLSPPPPGGRRHAALSPPCSQGPWLA